MGVDSGRSDSIAALVNVLIGSSSSDSKPPN